MGRISASGILMRFGFMGASIVIAVSPAQAQSTRPAPRPVADLKICTSIADAGQRLLCFDRAVLAFEEARDRGEITIIDTVEVRKMRKALFGLSLPQIKFFDSDGEEMQDNARLEGIIEAVSPVRGDRWNLTIEGAHWQTTETGYFRVKPKVGKPVVITRGILGSYILSIDGKPGMKVIRVR